MAKRLIKTEATYARILPKENKTPLPRDDDTPFWGDDFGMSEGVDNGMYNPVETGLDAWEIEYELEDGKTDVSHCNNRDTDNDDGWYDELSWATMGEPSNHSVRAKKKAERWDKFVVCMTTTPALFHSAPTTTPLDSSLVSSVQQESLVNISN